MHFSYISNDLKLYTCTKHVLFVPDFSERKTFRLSGSLVLFMPVRE